MLFGLRSGAILNAGQDNDSGRRHGRVFSFAMKLTLVRAELAVGGGSGARSAGHRAVAVIPPYGRCCGRWWCSLRCVGNVTALLPNVLMGCAAQKGQGVDVDVGE